MSNLAPGELKKPMVILDRADVLSLMDVLNQAAFAIESVAHLQGQEKTLLPYAERARKAAKTLDDRMVRWLGGDPS